MRCPPPPAFRAKRKDSNAVGFFGPPARTSSRLSHLRFSPAATGGDYKAGASWAVTSSRREPGGVLRQARRESVLSARRDASDRHVRHQLDQQQLARGSSRYGVRKRSWLLRREKRIQRDMRCAGSFKPLAPDRHGPGRALGIERVAFGLSVAARLADESRLRADGLFSRDPGTRDQAGLCSGHEVLQRHRLLSA